jgi:nucleoside-diphosphate-sugar epimerase
VYKQANEGTARIYWQDNGVTSIGLRPYVVYGVGRDQGLTSGATKAMLAAAADRPFHISHGGRMDFNYAEDVARAFIKCARAPHTGTSVHNVRGEGSHVDQLMAAIEAAAPNAAGKITYQSAVIYPFPEALDASSLADVIGEIPYTPLTEGVRRTVEHFVRLIDSGHIDVDRNLS